MRRLGGWFVPSDGEAGQWLLLVMREQADPSDGYDLLYEGVFDRVYTALGVPIAYLTEKSLDDVEVVIECHTLIGQIVFFLVGKHPLLRRLGRAEGFDERLLERIDGIFPFGTVSTVDVAPAENHRFCRWFSAVPRQRGAVLILG